MNASADEIILGIDLGTTNSLVAVVRSGKAEILKDGESSLIPSAVALDIEGRVVAVGQRARTLKSLDPERVIYSTKRLMGKGSADLAALTEDLPFDFSPSSEEMIRIKVGPRSLTPIEIAAEILKRCKFVAENHLGHAVKKAVVTVPAYFNDSQRVATAVAGKLAGLEVVRILNEPTAAALAYGISSETKAEVVAVYDFGGGTFDISILKIRDGVFEVLSTDGDTQLGGDDLDSVISNWLIEKAGEAPTTSEDRVMVLSQAELLKRSLSETESLHFSLHWGGKIRWEGSVDRAEIEALMEPTVKRTIELCERAVKAWGGVKTEIEEVVLVGGSTRLPLVRERVREFFKKTPRSEIDPDQAVALGAAIQASILAGQRQDTLLLDVVPLSLGIETIGGLVSKIITRNTTIPCMAHENYTTSVDNQTAVDLHILQGEREFVSHCRSLGRFKLRIPPQPAGLPKVQVRFVLDANGVLQVTAVDEKTKERASLEVRPSFGLSDEQVEKLLKEAWDFAEKDFADRLLIEARTQAEALLRATEKSLQSPLLDLPLRQEQEKRLQPLFKALRADLEGGSAAVIATRTKELDEQTRPLAQLILDRAVQQRLSDQKIESVR